MADAPKTDIGLDDFSVFAKEFAALLVASDLDIETQEALIGALPEMELEEIIDLVGALEAKAVVGETNQLDENLDAQIEQVINKFSTKEEEIDDETVRRLEALAEEL